MSDRLDVNYAPVDRPSTMTDSDLDAYGTPVATSPFIPPRPLGDVPAHMPSAYSLATSTPRDSGYNNYADASGTPNNSAPLLPPGERTSAEQYNKEAAGFYGATARKRPFYKKPWFYVLLAAAAVVVALAVALPVTLIKKNHDTSSASASGGSSSGGGSSGNTGGGGGGGSTTTNLATSGGDGSTVTKADGTTFVYHNSFGGFCKCN